MSEPSPTRPRPGDPIDPAGDPMGAGVGPGAWSERPERPDLTLEGEPRIVPLRVAPDFHVDPGDPDPREMPVHGTDGTCAGVVVDLWIDRAEPYLRFLEVELGPDDRVLLPFPFAKIESGSDGPRIRVDAIRGDQFRDVPRLAHPDRVTLREEDRIGAYYAGGALYAEPRRREPLL